MSFLLAFDQLRNHSICIKISAYHVHRFHLNNSGLGSLEHVQWGVWVKNSRHEVAVKKMRSGHFGREQNIEDICGKKPSLKPSRPETVELKPPYIQLKVNA